MPYPGQVRKEGRGKRNFIAALSTERKKTLPLETKR